MFFYKSHKRNDRQFVLIISIHRFKIKKNQRFIKKKIFEFVNERDVSLNIRVFNARFVNEIKNENIEQTYEKSRLII